MASEAELRSIRARLVEAALPHVPFEGWSPALLDLAANEAEIPVAQAKAALPGGVADLLRAWSSGCDAQMLAQLSAEDMDGLKIREKIALAVRTRLMTMRNDRLAARKALSFFAYPLNHAAGAECLARTMDAIWRAIGDRSTDFNFYTKRATLAGVYSLTLNRWLNDDSEGFSETFAYLDRRIGDVMRFEKAKQGAGKFLMDLPDPFSLLARIRYPL
ncbi:MAG: COQ9 family protein [Alphaproteobacteria bacterium]|nr:COQ9 family protein [Alphaproteobacteria bacterium]